MLPGGKTNKSQPRVTTRITSTFYLGMFQRLTYRETEVWNGDEACPGSFSESAVRVLSYAICARGHTETNGIVREVWDSWTGQLKQERPFPGHESRTRYSSSSLLQSVRGPSSQL